MNWLHNLTPPIVHRDMKPANVLISIRENYWLAKICDFGLSTVRDVAKLTTKNLVGSVAWMAPEVLLRQPFDEKVDIYAYSLILWQMFTCSQYPMDTSGYRSIQELTRAVCENFLRPEIPDKVPEKVAKMLRQGWSDDTSERPSFSKIIQTLKKTMVPNILNNNNAGVFWNANWTEISIPFKSFYQRLYAHFEINVPTSVEEDGIDWTFHTCLDAVLRELGNEVNLESLGKILNWFGEFDEGLFRRVYELLKQDWYHGPVDRDGAEFALRTYGKKNGFLVRVSPTVETPFTLSYLKSKKSNSVTHHRIARTATGFSFSERTKNQKAEYFEAPTLIELVDILMKEKKI